MGLRDTQSGLHDISQPPQLQTLFHSREAKALRSEIATLCQSEPVRERLCDISPWSIWRAPGEQWEDPAYILGRSECKEAQEGRFLLTNLVLQGGGTLGLAHAGFVVGLEEAGFRFPALAGTSAGAIIISGILASRRGDLTRPVGAALSQLVAEVPMDQFIDAPRPVRRAIKRLVAGRSVLNPIYWPGLTGSIRRILRRRGLNLGWEFQRFMREVFDQAGLKTNADLLDHLNKMAASLIDAKGVEDTAVNPFKEIRGRDLFRMISTAMPTGTKMRLPNDIGLLHEECKFASPALLVRMSMAIPLFFEPIEHATNPKVWPRFARKSLAKFVDDQTASTFEELNSLTFLDGGLFSNLPTDEVEGRMSPEIPSISVPLVNPSPKKKYQSARRPTALAKQAFAVFDAVRLQRDRVVHGSPNKRRILCKIDTGTAHWLNFAMNAQEKETLYLMGLRAARDWIAKGAIK